MDYNFCSSGFQPAHDCVQSADIYRAVELLITGLHTYLGGGGPFREIKYWPVVKV